MEALLVRRPRGEKGRPWRMAFALGAAAMALALSVRVDAQSLDSRPARTPVQQDSPRRARTLRPERSALTKDVTRDYADATEGASFLEGQTDIAFLEARIRDLSAKVRELNDLLQKHKEAAEPVHFVLRPMRVTLIEQHQPQRLPKTYGEALEVVVRNRARAIRATFNDGKERTRLAIDPDPAEVQRLLGPIDAWLVASGSPAEITYAHLQALVYATLLEARAKMDGAEPLPIVHKMLRDLHVDRAALTEHLRRSFLLDHPALGRELGAILAATAATFPEPSSVRDFLVCMADAVGADLKDELLRKAAYPYRGDAEGQFGAAAENATRDNGDVLRLQVELQRMLVEAKALRAANRVSGNTAGTWQHRLLQAERELDRLVRAADSEREAVMTLARRLPMGKEATAVAGPSVESLPVEPAQEVASDGLTTQH